MTESPPMAYPEEAVEAFTTTFESAAYTTGQFLIMSLAIVGAGIIGRWMTLSAGVLYLALILGLGVLGSLVVAIAAVVYEVFVR